MSKLNGSLIKNYLNKHRGANHSPFLYMKASKLISKKQRTDLYGQYIYLKNNKYLDKKVNFEMFLTTTQKLWN